MRKAMLFAVTEHTLLHVGEIREITSMVVRRDVVVKTPNHKIGAAVIVAGRIITALSLVKDFSLVDVWFAQNRKTLAVVSAKDEDNNLARLELYDEGGGGNFSFKSFSSEVERENPTRAGSPRAIGDPLFVATNRTGFPSVRVAGMMYNTILCESKRDTWRIRPDEPRGLVGSGVWNEDGEFMGLSIGERVAPPEQFLAAARKWILKDRSKRGDKNTEIESESDSPRVYGIHAEEVLNFAESG